MQDTSPHHAVLLDIIAKELNIVAKDIVDFELNLCDTQPGVIGGEISFPTLNYFVWHYQSRGNLDLTLSRLSASVATASKKPWSISCSAVPPSATLLQQPLICSAAFNVYLSGHLTHCLQTGTVITSADFVLRANLCLVTQAVVVMSRSIARCSSA